MKIIATSFKRSHAFTAILSAPSPAAGHCQPIPPLQTPGHFWASLDQSLVGSLLLSSGSWCAQGSVCACQECVSQSCVSSGGSVVGLMETSSMRASAITRSAAPRASAPVAVQCWPIPHRRHSNTVLSQSLWGLWVLLCTRFLWAFWAFLVEMGFDSKCDLAPPTVLLELLLCS